MISVGIDPGVNGGIAIVRGRGVVKLWSFHDSTISEMVEMFKDLYEMLHEIKRPGEAFTLREPTHIMLERVHAMPSKFRGCSTSWVLAENFATIKTLLTVYGLPWELVLPEKWQSVMGVRLKKTKEKVDKKKINRERAQALFPGQDGITKETADALLIAEYCRRVASYTSKATKRERE